MKETVENAKKMILAALSKVDEPDIKCVIQVKKEDEKNFEKALSLPEVQSKLKEKNTLVFFRCMTKKQLEVIIDYRTLGLSLLIAAEQLEKVTNLPKPTWVSYLAHTAKELILKDHQAAEEAMSYLHIIDIYEGNFMDILFSVAEEN